MSKPPNRLRWYHCDHVVLVVLLLSALPIICDLNHGLIAASMLLPGPRLGEYIMHECTHVHCHQRLSMRIKSTCALYCFFVVSLYMCVQAPRKWVITIVDNPWFDRIVISVILANCVTLAL